jgi:hypothetical protein
VRRLLLILVAHGLHYLGTRARLAGVLAGIVILLGAGWSLSNYYFDSDYARSPRWRSLVQSLQAGSEPADVIVQNYPDPGLNYYYDGDLPIRLLPASETSSEESTARALEKLASTYRRVWLIPAPAAAWDRDGAVERWLARHADLASESEHGSLHLKLYNTPLAFLEEMRPVGVGLGDRITLLGYRLEPGTEEPVGPGQEATLTLYWQALAPIDGNYTVFVHVADPDEQIRGQHDSQPVGGTYPTGEWQPGEIVVDRHPIQISPAAPPGLYRVFVGMYDGSTGQRLVAVRSSGVRDEDRITLTTLPIAGPTNSDQQQ